MNRIFLVISLAMGAVGAARAALACGTQQPSQPITGTEKAALVLPEARDAGGDDGGIAGGPPTCSGNATSLFYPCNPADGTWALVNFFGDGPQGANPAQGPANTPAGQENDDDSAFANFAFNFVLYGNTYGSCYINNNGNLSFGQSFNDFTSQSFPVAGFPMIAPFWADVDTRTGNGVVYYRQIDSNGDFQLDTLIVTWINVGYYDQHGDKRNTFQVAISNGTNPHMGLGHNVVFSYDNMCWTTGDASGGVGGFGGTPATVGANQGDGIHSFQLGRFGNGGSSYDGPGGAIDGVNWLDSQTISLNTDLVNNIPPVPTNFPVNNEISVLAGDAFTRTVNFQSPEPGQTTQIFVTDLDDAIMNGCSVAKSSGNTATATVSWSTDCQDVGSYRLSLRAVDNFNPPGVQVVELLIHVLQPTDLPTVAIASPAPFACVCMPVTFTGSAYDAPLSERRFDDYELQYSSSPSGPWTTFATGTTHVNNSTLGVWNMNLAEGYYFIRLVARELCGPDASAMTLVYLERSFGPIDLRSPENTKVYGGNVCFDGTVNDHCFDHYTVEFAPPPYSNFSPVGPPSYTTPVINDPFATWDTDSGPSVVPDGPYRVRVRGYDICGFMDEKLRDIIVDNRTPVALITSIHNCESLAGVVEIRGTASDANIAGWTLQYSGGPTNGWVTIAQGTTSVTNSVLANWNVAALPHCSYALRLLVSDKATLDCLGNQHHQSEYVVTLDNGIRGDLNCDGQVNNFDIDSFVICVSTGVCGCE